MTAPLTGKPTPPIDLDAGAGARRRLAAAVVDVGADVLERLRGACAEVETDATRLADAGRDWWPLAMSWALDGDVPGRAAALCRPGDADQVAEVLRVCNDARVPVTASAGRSGVCGASVPVHGGVLLDLTALAGLIDVDRTSMLLDVLPGTFGDALEEHLRDQHDLTLGHWPQSISLSTVGGWLACRSGGQLSNRYGKIEDMVVGLDVVLADGRQIRTGGHARQAVGPDLNQVFVGSEGTLGVITRARLRLNASPVAERRAAWGFGSFSDGLAACRRVIQRGAPVAVLRLYDAIEADRSYQTGDRHVVLALDEGDPHLVEASMRVLDESCSEIPGAERLDDGLVGRWLEHRNDVAALEALTRKGFVVDTMEITGAWGDLDRIYERTTEAIRAVPHALAASAHQSHAYRDGACLYFTFAGRPPAEEKDAFYVAAWDAGTRAVLAEGGALSHHHGVGLNRARFVADALGSGFDVLVQLKEALDPNGVLNPGKLGLPDPFGPVGWP